MESRKQEVIRVFNTLIQNYILVVKRFEEDQILCLGERKHTNSFLSSICDRFLDENVLSSSKGLHCPFILRGRIVLMNMVL